MWNRVSSSWEYLRDRLKTHLRSKIRLWISVRVDLPPRSVSDLFYKTHTYALVHARTHTTGAITPAADRSDKRLLAWNFSRDYWKACNCSLPPRTEPATPRRAAAASAPGSGGKLAEPYRGSNIRAPKPSGSLLHHWNRIPTWHCVLRKILRMFFFFFLPRMSDYSSEQFAAHLRANIFIYFLQIFL